MVRICVVNGCKKEAYPGCGISFHRFPVNEDVKRKWMEVLKISRTLSKYAVVCSLHFRHEDFLTEAKKWLNPEAVPSLLPNLLPENNKTKLLSSFVLTKAENPMPGPSEESARKKIKLQTEISTQTHEFSTPRKAKLRRDIKILKQRLKRRDIKIKNLEDTLRIKKKKCNNYVELENLGPPSLDVPEEEECQEEWLSEEALTDDDTNLNVSMEKSDIQENTSQETLASNSTIESKHKMSDKLDIEHKLDSFDNSQNSVELAGDLDAFLIKKDFKAGDNRGSEIDESASQSDDDGHDTDDLLRLLSEDGVKKEKKNTKLVMSKPVVNREQQQFSDDDDDDDYIFEGSKVTQLKVAKSVLMRSGPVSKAVPEDLSDSDGSSDEAGIVKKMFGVRRLNVASKSTTKSAVVHLKKATPDVNKRVSKPFVSSTPLHQYVNKKSVGESMVDMPSKPQQKKPQVNKPIHEEFDAEEEIHEEFLEEEELDMDENYTDKSNGEQEARETQQHIMKPEEMDEEVLSDEESLSDNASNYDDFSLSDSDETDEWFTLDIRAERAGEYIPLLGSKAYQVLTEEKRRVKARLDELRQSLSTLSETDKQQAQQILEANATLAQLDALIAVS